MGICASFAEASDKSAFVDARPADVADGCATVTTFVAFVAGSDDVFPHAPHAKKTRDKRRQRAFAADEFIEVSHGNARAAPALHHLRA
jgi:hypothetical protein